jgi:hypothetical protein
MLTSKQLETIQKSDPEPFKFSYINSFYNLFSYVFNRTKFNNDEKYINTLLSNQNLDMTEITKNSETITTKNYSNIVSYIAGNCWLNAKLSNNISLSPKDKEIHDSINDAVNNTKPLSYPITLFHGFEKYTYYNEKTWKINDTINIKGFLSKTPSFDIASKFANQYDFTNPKFLVVNYPIGSKHIHLDIRKYDEEYEYLTNSNEKLKLVRICYYLKFPQLMTFYICNANL